MNNKSDCHRILSARKIGIVLPEAIMRCPVQLSVMALVLLASPIAWAQRDGHVLSGSSIARFSYTNTWPLDNKDDESSQICFAVQQDGHYQMRRLTAKGATELVGGTVPAVELKKLEKLLEAPEFRGLTSSVGGVIFNGEKALRQSFLVRMACNGFFWQIQMENGHFQLQPARSSIGFRTSNLAMQRRWT